VATIGIETMDKGVCSPFHGPVL